MQFNDIIVEIADLLVIDKKISTNDLIQNDFQVPADRIIKFMKNIKIQIESKPYKDLLDDYFLQELAYAQREIN